MMSPPVIMRLRHSGSPGGVNLWLPLFPLLAPVFLLGVLFSPLVLVAGLLLWPTGLGRTILLLGPALYRVLASLRGLEVDVKNEKEHVYIAFV